MRDRFVLVLTAVLVGSGLTVVGATPASASTITLNPVADSYVQSDLPTANFGTVTSVKVDGSPVTTSYLKFDVQGLAAAPGKATLRVFKSLSTTTAITLRPVADTTWSESGINYVNKPAPGGTPITPPGPWGTDVWLTYDVTSLVKGNGLVSFALDTASSTSKSLPSREASTNKPELVLETATERPHRPSRSPSPSGATLPAAQRRLTTTAVPGRDRLSYAETSDLVRGINPQQVFALGDLQYNSGSTVDFGISYQNSWGRFQDITRPVVGNHEYGTSGAGGYFGYFGSAATPSNRAARRAVGYYGFNVPVGASKWHVVVINSECTRINAGIGCAKDSPQYKWLVNDLALPDNRTLCTAVLSHRPRWSSNSFASPDIQPLVDVMSANKVDLLLTGHAHSYERFAPQNAAGQSDPAGIREIIVGTGGRDSQGFGTVVANSVVRKNHIFGVMKLSLTATGYSYEFVPDPTTPFSDSGSGSCN